MKGDIHGAYDFLCGWYKTRGGKPPHPTQKDLDMICHQIQNLYQEDEPPGNPNPVHVLQAPIRDDI